MVSLHWTDAGIEERDFLAGFEQDGEISGRPVDVAQSPDGAIYISDDYAGAIYRVTYTGDEGAVIAMGNTVAESSLEAEASWLDTADLAALTDQGQQLYSDNGCAECHEGGESPVSLADLNQRLDHAAVIDALKAPQAPMPIYPLSESQYQALAVYLLREED